MLNLRRCSRAILERKDRKTSEPAAGDVEIVDVGYTLRIPAPLLTLASVIVSPHCIPPPLTKHPSHSCVSVAPWRYVVCICTFLQL